MVLLVMGLPVALLVAGLILGRAYWRVKRVRWMVGGSVVMGVGAGLVNLWAIFHSTSSTAAIGVLFVPVVMEMGGVVGAVLGLMVHEAVKRPRSVWGVVSMAGLAGVMWMAGGVAVRIGEFEAMKGERDGGVLRSRAEAKLRARDYFVLAAIAGNERTPAETLQAIAEYADGGLHEKRMEWINAWDRDQMAVVRKVVRNKNTPVEALVRLAGSGNEYVKGDVAQEARTPVEVLRRLAEEPHGYLVDWGLAANARTPAEWLERMPYEQDRVVAQMLARNAGTPAGLLERLAGHEDAVVRGGVAGNRRAGVETLRRLAGDNEAWIARQAAWTLERRGTEESGR